MTAVNGFALTPVCFPFDCSAGTLPDRGTQSPSRSSRVFGYHRRAKATTGTTAVTTPRFRIVRGKVKPQIHIRSAIQIRRNI